MAEHLYVATNAEGVERTARGEVTWNLPAVAGATTSPAERTAAPRGELVLRRPAALLEALDERIFLAEAIDGARDAGDTVGASTARLTAETAWGVKAAARFALECASHALDDVTAATTLPDGSSLGAVVAEARVILDRTSPAGEQRLGLLARFAALRRLRRLESELGDITLERLTEDLGADLDALDDPAWTTIAACSEAVLAALEALRHLAAPRYARSREEVLDEHPATAPSVPSSVLPTPWGPIALGAEHFSPYEPAWAAARDAAARARESAADRPDPGAAASERVFQADLLERILLGPD
ncbi:MAG TPA: hypothetical protein VED84_05590 [Acidimicrobiales bacterium]|nr:hypothetical protein [Acidimicrobiales bacterium]